MNTITPSELNDRYQRGEAVRLFDVRTPAEFREIHIPFAVNRPLESLDTAAILRACHEDPHAATYVVCQKGGRGASACAKLTAAGLDRVANVDGGTAAWEQAGLPVVRGKKTISLERQVRIAAGTLVLLGSALGYFVHPYFIELAAFVGAGLVFAGITDTCGMGMMLARMPWNQVSAAESDVDSPAASCQE